MLARGAGVVVGAELAELPVGDLALAHVERTQQRHLVRALVWTPALLAAVGARLEHATRDDE